MAIEISVGGIRKSGGVSRADTSRQYHLANVKEVSEQVLGLRPPGTPTTARQCTAPALPRQEKSLQS